MQDIAPGYEEKHFTIADKKGQLRLIASSDGRDGSVLVHQDVNIFASIMTDDDKLNYQISSGRTAYLHLIKGHISVNGQTLSSGDALKVVNESELTIDEPDNAEFLLFDLPF